MVKIFFSFFLLCFSLNSSACEIIDDANHVLNLKAPASRIISLAPDLTEILFAIDAGNKIVGVIQGSDYPAAAKKIPIVGRYNGLDLEKIMALKPDLIVVWGEGKLAGILKSLHIPVYVSHPHHLLDIPKTMERLGCLAGTEKAASMASKQFLKTYHELKNKYAYEKKVSVFYQVWPQPLLTVSHESWINDVIELCGGKNIFMNLIGAAPEVSMESVIIANPTVIFQTQASHFWEKWPHLLAVKNKNIFTLSPNFVERASPRILIGVSEVCFDLKAAREKESISHS
jgi:iron complex transport system substrate-binding protein